jgi:hypothetical protein
MSATPTTAVSHSHFHSLFTPETVSGREISRLVMAATNSSSPEQPPDQYAINPYRCNP